ncbi:MAG: hypothetical protein N838_02995 [Thiohalocapsa sp. PB-PSB1]|nr:MAG: hypothetical protein N838_02995 [Thiohalocapsa sp. PB-PSB1]
MYWQQSEFGQSASILTAELVDAAAGIDYLLFAGVKRMAGRADLHMEFISCHCGARRELVTTTAHHLEITVRGMDSLFHRKSLVGRKDGQ